MLRFDRKQQNSVNKLSFNKKKIFFKCKEKFGLGGEVGNPAILEFCIKKKSICQKIKAEIIVRK